MSPGFTVLGQDLLLRFRIRMKCLWPVNDRLRAKAEECSLKMLISLPGALWGKEWLLALTGLVKDRRAQVPRYSGRDALPSEWTKSRANGDTVPCTGLLVQYLEGSFTEPCLWLWCCDVKAVMHLIKLLSAGGFLPTDCRLSQRLDRAKRWCGDITPRFGRRLFPFRKTLNVNVLLLGPPQGQHL